MNTDKVKRSKRIILILSALGLLVSLYLSYLHITDSQAGFCTAGSACDAVRMSEYSSLLGIPVAAYGVIAFGLIWVLSLLTLKERVRWLALYVVSLGGVAFSLYLTYIELFVIDAICVYCVASAVIILLVFITVLLSKPFLDKGLSTLSKVALSVVVAAAVVFGSAMIQSISVGTQAGAANEYQTGLAKHLRKNGAIMFGSFKCPHCNEQKKLFGDAFKYIAYVECHPKGENANPSLCFARGILNYPTWEIKGRHYSGALSLEDLSKLSGFKYDKPQTNGE